MSRTLETSAAIMIGQLFSIVLANRPARSDPGEILIIPAAAAVCSPETLFTLIASCELHKA